MLSVVFLGGNNFLIKLFCKLWVHKVLKFSLLRAAFLVTMRNWYLFGG